MAFMLPPTRVRKWARHGREVVAPFPVFAVERNDLVTPAGSPRSIYTLRVSDCCTVLATTDADEVVMVRQYRFGTDAISLETPGGMVDKYEPPEAACRRELLEETGYEADDFTELLACDNNPPLQGNRFFAYAAKHARKVGPPSFDENEECELVLVPRSALPALVDERKITHSLVLLAVHAFLRKGA